MYFFSWIVSLQAWWDPHPPTSTIWRVVGSPYQGYVESTTPQTILCRVSIAGIKQYREFHDVTPFINYLESHNSCIKNMWSCWLSFYDVRSWGLPAALMAGSKFLNTDIFVIVRHVPHRIRLLDKPQANSAFLPSRASSHTRSPTLAVPPMRVWSNMSVVVHNLYCVWVVIIGKLVVET